ncbi:MAG: YsnF/AvaK domain-containing protein [Proteobacteria bacterium]|nr:MAG: YsnF/AvaK domain-containing protein [Pseudomonadota bacterium]
MQTPYTQSGTVIGVFTDLDKAQNAVESLRREHVGTTVRLIENDFSEDFNVKADRLSNTKEEGGIGGFFARLFGFEDEKPRSELKLNADSELYFTDSYQNKHHFVLVEGAHDQSDVRSMIVSLGGTIEDRGNELYEREVFSRSGLRDDESVMELRDEQLKVEKRSVQTGEVHLRKDIIEETRTIEVPVMREELVIETRPLTGSARPGSLSAVDIGERQEIRVPLSEEQITIQKEVVPREEIRLSKERIVENRTVTETLKHEEAHLEEEGRITMKGKDKDKARFKGKTPYRGDAEQPSI